MRTAAIAVGRHAQSALTRFKESGDARDMRAHLILEEAGEVMAGLSLRSEETVLDGLADLDYVVRGTALKFDLPFDAACREVHRSNMTKSTAAECRPRDGSRGKGPGFSPARIDEIIRQWRSFRMLHQVRAAISQMLKKTKP